MAPKSLVVVLGLLVPALVLVSRPALATWPNSPFTNLPVCRAVNDQSNPTIAADGAGGAIVTWQDVRSNTSSDIYAQHILASGAVDPAWPVDGRALCLAALNQNNPMIISDGAGGAIVTWMDTRAGASSVDIYAQHVLASGAVDPAWPADGRALCTAANNQNYPTIVADGAGGAIVTWYDFRSGTSLDIYAQHVLASGAVDPAWPADGRALCTAANNQLSPTIVADGTGGAIVTWYDLRGGTGYDIYAQHVLASGAVDPAWPADGRPLCTAANQQYTPTIVADGAGGAIVTWYDLRSGTSYDIYAQHVLVSGAVDPAWPADGRPLCTAANHQYAPMIVADGAGGAIVTWYDSRSGSSYDIYAQHVLASGAVDPAWPADGRALCTAASDQQYPTIVSDGAGGAIVTWSDYRGAANYDIYAQHVLASGAVDPAWPADGRALCLAAGAQQSATIVADGAGGAIVTWQDYRAGAADIYAQRVARFGYPGTPEAEILGVRDIPNDNGGKVKLSWNASYLDLNSDPNLTAYEIYRSVPPNYAALAIARGARVLRGFAEAPSPGAEALVVEQASGYSWEFLTTQTAVHYISSYSYLAPTAGDSTSYQNPKTAYMIVARNSTGSMYWISRPDSGYSVDNLPPFAPAPFAGQYGAGVAQLHWSPNSELDLANYRLYRGTTSGFTPSPANRIATPTDTLYNDAAGNTYYYKLSAIDIHGNESGYTTLLPAGALAVPPPSPRELSLERPSPNPASGSTTMRYALPRESRVTLAIFDPSGRVVRTLVNETAAAGEHQAAWDLRDAAGRAVGAGLYFVRLEAGGQKRVRRMTTMR